MSRTHIIGAGLAGLSAAAHLVERGEDVVVYESAGQAGGRCRSFFDKHLERIIDNGNHLIMSGNKSALDFLALVGSSDSLIGPDAATYPFVDVATGKRWIVRLDDGPIPFWVLDRQRRVPGTGIWDYFKATPIMFAGDQKTVSDIIADTDPLYKSFWEPLTLAVLNTTPAIGQAKLLAAVIAETFLRGGKASMPRIARDGLGPSFIDPAVKFIEANGGTVRTKARLRNMWIEGGYASTLNFGDETINCGEDDNVILAVPPTRLRELMPELNPPNDDASILNVHFVVSPELTAGLPPDLPFIACISSLAQWIFVRGDVISVTTSAANAIGADDQPNDTVVKDIWSDVCIALNLGEQNYDRFRVIREKRATPDQSPAGASRRLGVETQMKNIFLAGDHTDTGVPATIEGSIRSGARAANMVLAKQ